MELSIYNIKGEDTGRKITLNDSIYAIEKPNDHAIYLDVKQYLADNRQGTHKTKKEANSPVLLANSDARRVEAALAVATSTPRFSSEVHASSDRNRATIASNSTRK